ncbi:predicted protein [Histoplasma mississippiense (nom. inval.)]|uniref:predicted protein n=1 Tax=Ajellomyces capsulatus (strain NAm1 / WU24) TaxID=2059318 RepID=UPI000157D692|nr:predicted protein [Histoplasma mississippiense (nom. inval.)]EDN07513.1 predicted protein [Histoplasma mississippiense (nom. inval.)]
MMEVEHAGPKPVGRQTRPRSALTRWTSNPLDEEVEHAGPKPVGRQTRWTSNPLDEEVEHAGPNPLDVKPVPGAH